MIVKKKPIKLPIKPKKPLVFVNGVAVVDEDSLCEVCVRWFDRLFGDDHRFDLIHIPNEGKRTRWEGTRLQRMGLRAGTPDYLVQQNGEPVGWMEFKFGKNDLTPTQKEFKNYCEKGCFKYAIVKSFEEFKDTLQAWGIYDPAKESELRTSQIFNKWRIL
jgi:hypothetical protein